MPPAAAISWLMANHPNVGAGVSLPGPSGLLTESRVEETKVPSIEERENSLLPLPDKLRRKILEVNFIEMSELLPEVWMSEEEELPMFRSVLMMPKKRAGPVTDIMLWAQCFASYVAILASKFPSATPELLSYMAMIIKCARDYEGIAWAQYDRNFRKAKCQRKDLRWSQIDQTMYTVCFNSRNSRCMVCDHCLSDTHAAAQCPEIQSQWFWPSQPSGSGGNIRSVRGPGQFEKKQRKLEGGTTPRYCWTFNAGAKCSYESCKFAHICSECNGEHPKVSCNTSKASKGPGPMKRFRRGA